jgi:hypothetical protein
LTLPAEPSSPPPLRPKPEGRRRLDPHPDPGAAINALARLGRQKRHEAIEINQGSPHDLSKTAR